VPVIGLSNAVAITAAGAHTCAVLADGLGTCWGANNKGQLGDGTTSERHFRAGVISGLNSVVAIAAGETHTCGVRPDGFALCWGDNFFGQLGNTVLGSSFSTTAIFVLGGGGSFTARDIAAGRNHTCAVRANSTVACWGNNDSGQIGDGTIGANRLSPFTIPNLTGIVAIAAGEAHTCALVAALGRVLCWGLNSSGQLGDGTTSSRPTPVAVVGLTNAVAIAAGGALGSSHTCALLADGTVRCWGANGSGQLGTGNTVPSSIPVVVRGLTNAVSIALGETHTCAVVAVGVPFCWGFNGRGQLGTSPPLATQLTPTLVSLDNTVAIAGGNTHSCALRADGSTWCWGGNLLGQLGINSTASPQSLPRLVVDPTNAVVTSAVAVAGGFGHSCAMVADGTARCWGDNAAGQLGNATTTSSTTPMVVGRQIFGIGVSFFSPLRFVVNITTGRRHSCALIANGAVSCWGENTFGQLGNNSMSNSSVPVGVPSFTLNIDPGVTLEPNGRVTTVTVVATCEEGQWLHIDVTLTQEAVSGRGIATGQCTGGLTRYPVLVPAQGRYPFVAGPAIAAAEAIIREQGAVVDTQQWTRQVTIVNAP
jgi:alpha-tubulin suppressor-like RCC1 family protein